MQVNKLCYYPTSCYFFSTRSSIQFIHKCLVEYQDKHLVVLSIQNSFMHIISIQTFILNIIIIKNICKIHSLVNSNLLHGLRRCLRWSCLFITIFSTITIVAKIITVMTMVELTRLLALRINSRPIPAFLSRFILMERSWSGYYTAKNKLVGNGIWIVQSKFYIRINYGKNVR